jgi:putative intracellular protease/amidase
MLLACQRLHRYLRSWKRSERSAPSQRAKYRPALEQLETRALLTASMPISMFQVEAVDAVAREYGQDAATFRVCRGGDTSQAVEVSYTLGGTATGDDFAALPSTLRFAAGEVSRIVTLTPTDDTAIEGDVPETVSLTLTAGAGYRVHSLRASAAVSIVDGDGYVHAELDLQNAGFETGDLSGWTLLPAETNRFAAVANTQHTTAAHGGDFFAWGAGAARPWETSYPAGLAQNIDLSEHAAAIDRGDARLDFTGWGVGNGWSGGPRSYLEVVFFDANGQQLGATQTSNEAFACTWTELRVEAVAPEGARSVELRAMARRLDNNPWGLPAGVDDLAARLVYADDPTVSVEATDAAAGEIGNDRAVFTVRRATAADPMMNRDLIVHYTLSGTAVNGVDFATLSGNVTIPAGATTATIDVHAWSDQLAESAETIVLTLDASADYHVGSAATAAATVADPPPVLMVIGNRDFYYQEYDHTRRSLESQGFRVVVAAATLAPATPHANSGQGTGSGIVRPDIMVAQADAADYSAIVFVGGYGASAYQYAFEGQYLNSAYNGSAALQDAVNDLIGDFVHQDKQVAAICHGVSVLAWARVDGDSPLDGKQVVAYEGLSPAFLLDGQLHAADPDRLGILANGASVFAPRSVGNPFNALDDVYVDGNIITAQNWDSAALFGRVLAEEIRSAGPEIPS